MKNKETRAYSIKDMPKKYDPEFAFIGRSNVGKSSLLNAILGTGVAKISQTPGCTLWIGIHSIFNKTLIDLPGYGYAKTTEGRKNSVNKLVQDYFDTGRPDTVFLLVDSRRGFMQIDQDILYVLDQYNYDVKLVGTKFDKKGAHDQKFDFKVSVQKKTGIEEMREYIKSFSIQT
jgi:GTP-binding protein